MTWDRNELVVLSLAMIIIAGLAAIDKVSATFVEGTFTLIVGYAVGRIFNHAQGKE